jgi:hypothetical protein
MFSMMLRESGWKAKAGKKPGTSRRALASSTNAAIAPWMSLGSFLKVTVLKLQTHSSVHEFKTVHDTGLTPL